MIHPQVHLRIPCYDFYFLYLARFTQILHNKLALPESKASESNAASSKGTVAAPMQKCAKAAVNFRSTGGKGATNGKGKGGESGAPPGKGFRKSSGPPVAKKPRKS